MITQSCGDILMLYGFLVTIYSICLVLLILLILIQKSKGSMGLGAMSGSSQMLFGGSGGQDVLQKTTWVLGAIMLLGSLGLSLLRTHSIEKSSIVTSKAIPAKTQQSAPAQTQETGTTKTAPQEGQPEQKPVEETKTENKTAQS